MAPPRQLQQILDALLLGRIHLARNHGLGLAAPPNTLHKIPEEVQPLRTALHENIEVRLGLLGRLVLVAAAALVLGRGLGLARNVGVADVDPRHVVGALRR